METKETWVFKDEKVPLVPQVKWDDKVYVVFQDLAVIQETKEMKVFTVLPEVEVATVNVVLQVMMEKWVQTEWMENEDLEGNPEVLLIPMVSFLHDIVKIKLCQSVRLENVYYGLDTLSCLLW